MNPIKESATGTRAIRADINAAFALLAFEEGVEHAETSEFQEIALHLNDIRDLFIAPEYDPFAGDVLSQSGLEYIADMLKPTRLDRKLRAVITLPQLPGDSMTLHVQTQAAVARYCRTRIEADRLELASLRWQGLKAPQTGIIFLGICLSLSAAASTALFLSESMRSLLSEGFLIAGWVSLWHPVELLLYEWWPLWRQIRVYEHITDIQFYIQVGT